ncbi:MAG: RluA family pseudouridine synthase [Halothiobacillaceae bacterium]|jgi:tRNA pseudouridine32 synthase/23S rRNA pseudouridine746 synthase|nr:RluA family pseudouridine synthase [Halothiobacillaceae bacterium]
MPQPERPTPGVTLPGADYCLRHEDASFLVVSKPPFMLSVPGKEPGKLDSLILRVQREYPEARIVHRLDWDTSGLLVIARGARPHAELSRQFQDRETRKTYQAMVAGEPQNNEGEIDLPMRVDLDNRPRQIICHIHGRHALTRWRVLERLGECTRLSLEPVTGRSHQLRLHMQCLGHPILGDTLYAPPEIQNLSPRLLLHAERLGFTHPVSGQPLEFLDPAPF